MDNWKSLILGGALGFTLLALAQPPTPATGTVILVDDQGPCFQEPVTRTRAS